MTKAILMMTFKVRGLRSFPQNPPRRRRRCVSSEWAICPSFPLASARHPLWMALTEGLRPTENGTRRLNPLPRRDSSLCYRVCFAPPPARRRPSRGVSRPLAVEVVERLPSPRLSEPKLGMKNFFRLHMIQIDRFAAKFKNKVR